MNQIESYSEIGTLLKKARDEMQLSVPEASKLLHIRVRYLAALEEGRLSDLPGLAYAKGYLHAYASFLQLDASELLRRYEQVEKGLPGGAFYFPEVFSKEKKPSNMAIWGGLSAALAIYLVWVAVFMPRHPPLSVIFRPADTQGRKSANFC